MTRAALIKPKLPQHLRRLSIYVDEPDHGQFYWVMIESIDDASVWHDVASSQECFNTWVEAHDAGIVELMKLVDNELTGPLAPAEDENASPVAVMPIAD